MFKLKQDKYRKARGGWSRFITIYCNSCNTPILLYQKDGPGPQKRLYFDRIFAPEALTDLARKSYSKHLVCHKCSLVLGDAGIYDKEPRLIYKMRPGFFYKKISKGEFPLST